MKTKDRILEAALHLFNQKGTAAVSTNHIAEAAGISPGNLYYHFRNKEEIIRALFERLFAEWDVTLVLPTDRLITLADIQHLVRENFRIIAKYAFIHREIVALLLHDKALHDRFIQVRHRGFEGFHTMFAMLVETGVLETPAQPEEMKRLAELCWLISEFWLSSLEISGRQLDDQATQDGVNLMLQVLQPYLNS